MKHAYLIIANKNPNQLQTLITTIDDSRNDIYLLIDDKSLGFSRTFQTDYSSLTFVDSLKIYWGGYSQIRAELRLFHAAAPYNYGYYHLISGVDLPLDNQDNIHSFFDNHLNREFLTYGILNDYFLKNILWRMKPHLFRKHYRSNNKLFIIYRKIENRLLNYVKQRKIPTDYIGYASNWLSIDNDLVQLIVNSDDWAKDTFYKGALIDELFVPTLINYHPDILNKVYYRNPIKDDSKEFRGNLRYIVFKNDKSSPHIWKSSDYNELMNARKNGHLFARKFDENVDREIINKLVKHIL